MAYSDFISISEQFKNSINIEYDLLNNSKIKNYIPTKDSNEVLKYYFDSFKDSNLVRATVLEGPYGKGKSYLLLTLLQIVSLDKNSLELSQYLNKLQRIDPSFEKEIVSLKDNDFKLLPVIVNSNYSHLPQALNMALKDALNRVGLSELFPNTSYEIALDIISKWENTIGYDSVVINKCLAQYKTKLDALKKGLANYDENSYNTFVDLYNCIVPGLEFNPFASNDVVKNYSDISRKITDCGYNGIFIVFDEFSKFIESENESLPMDLKVLQDLAEMVNRSETENQMHLCCITHKSLSNYCHNLNGSFSNAFRTVEGRFKEIRFNRSINQNYQIISYALNRNLQFKKYFDEFKKKNAIFYESVLSLDIFNEADDHSLTYGCFPLNPLTTYTLINVSELIAQNERTLFTFISDNDPYSLSTFIANNNDGLANVDLIYDYFSRLFSKGSDQEIKKIYVKSEAAISKADFDLEKSIIKVIAILNLLNDDQLLSSENIIALCLNKSVHDIEKELIVLTEKKILKKSFATNLYDFALSNSKFVDQQIDEFLAKINKNASLSTILNNIYDDVYILPRRYNAKYKLTRFYKEIYITDIDLANLSSFNKYYDDYFCDGFILRVIKTKFSNEEIFELYKGINNNKTVILKIANKQFSRELNNEILKLLALINISKNKNLDEIIREELHLMIDEQYYDLTDVLNSMYKIDNCHILSLYSSENYNDLLSVIMETIYNATPIINNEMINKESGVTMQYIKPRNTIVNRFLMHNIDCNVDYLVEFSKTSPENTVFNSVKNVISSDDRKILDELKEVLLTTNDSKICCSELIQRLKKPPYGMRMGVIPLIIAMAIFELNDNLIFYYDSREIDLNADNLNKMCVLPEKYFISLQKDSKNQSEYLISLMHLFNIETKNNFRTDIKVLVNYLQNWALGLPRLIRCQKTSSNFLGLQNEFIEFIHFFNSFNLNEYQTIFYEIPNVFNGDYNQVIRKLEVYINSVEDVINNYKYKLSLDIKNLLKEKPQSSLTAIFKQLIIENEGSIKSLNASEKALVKIFESNNYNDSVTVDSISKVVIGVAVTDWEANNSKLLLDFIDEFMVNLSKRVFVSELSADYRLSNLETLPISKIGIMLKNNIEQSLEEFGESVSNEEKVKILYDLINTIE